MSRSVTMPSGLSFSITTTAPTSRSRMALAAAATGASVGSAVGVGVITSSTAMPDRGGTGRAARAR